MNLRKQILNYFSCNGECSQLSDYIASFRTSFPWFWDIVFIIIVEFMMTANSRIRYGLQIVFVCLYITPSHYHNCANVSVDIEFMKCLPDMFFVECVSKIEHILLVIHYSIYGAVCFQFTQFPHDGWENILLCLIIIIKSEVWTSIHCLGLGHETMVCAVCLFIFLLRYLYPLRQKSKCKASTVALMTSLSQKGYTKKYFPLVHATWAHPPLMEHPTASWSFYPG